MVIWGDLQRSESQRHPCHDCYRAVLSCPSDGLHFIPCPLGVWLPPAFGMLWGSSHKGFHAQVNILSPHSAPGQTHGIVAPALPKDSPPCTPLLLHELFFSSRPQPQAEDVGLLLVKEAGIFFPESEQPGGALSLTGMGQQEAVQGRGAAVHDVLHIPQGCSSSWEHLQEFCGC